MHLHRISSQQHEPFFLVGVKRVVSVVAEDAV